MTRFIIGLASVGVLGGAVLATAMQDSPTAKPQEPAKPTPEAQERALIIKASKPSMTLDAPPPADGKTIVLFDGREWAGWHTRENPPGPSAWKAQGDGSVLVQGGDAISDREFGDFQLHLEFLSPKTGKDGQARGNSGLYLHGRYEIQILDSFGDEPLGNGCGAVYSIAPPLVNASRPADMWQTYDVVFRAPRMGEDGKVAEPARVTVLHNGIVIHNNLALPKTTGGSVGEEVVIRGPIMLQDHGDPVRFRNIWIRELN